MQRPVLLLSACALLLIAALWAAVYFFSEPRESRHTEAVQKIVEIVQDDTSQPLPEPGHEDERVVQPEATDFTDEKTAEAEAIAKPPGEKEKGVVIDDTAVLMYFNASDNPSSPLQRKVLVSKRLLLDYPTLTPSKEDKGKEMFAEALNASTLYLEPLCVVNQKDLESELKEKPNGPLSVTVNTTYGNLYEKAAAAVNDRYGSTVGASNFAIIDTHSHRFQIDTGPASKRYELKVDAGKAGDVLNLRISGSPDVLKLFVNDGRVWLTYSKVGFYVKQNAISASLHVILSLNFLQKLDQESRLNYVRRQSHRARQAAGNLTVGPVSAFGGTSGGGASSSVGLENYVTRNELLACIHYAMQVVKVNGWAEIPEDDDAFDVLRDKVFDQLVTEMGTEKLTITKKVVDGADEFSIKDNVRPDLLGDIAAHTKAKRDGEAQENTKASYKEIQASRDLHHVNNEDLDWEMVESGGTMVYVPKSIDLVRVSKDVLDTTRHLQITKTVASWLSQDGFTEPMYCLVEEAAVREVRHATSTLHATVNKGIVRQKGDFNLTPRNQLFFEASLTRDAKGNANLHLKAEVSEPAPDFTTYKLDETLPLSFRVSDGETFKGFGADKDSPSNALIAKCEEKDIYGSEPLNLSGLPEVKVLFSELKVWGHGGENNVRNGKYSNNLGGIVRRGKGKRPKEDYVDDDDDVSLMCRISAPYVVETKPMRLHFTSRLHGAVSLVP